MVNAFFEPIPGGPGQNGISSIRILPQPKALPEEFMIGFLRGRLAASYPHQVVVDVHGVGYEVLIPLSTFDTLGEIGEDLQLLTHLVVREDSQTLFGFRTSEERDLFRLLISRVSGVGPKVALSVLSGMKVEDFKRAVVSNDVATLSKIKGLGKKTVERIVLELKDKVGVATAWETAAQGSLPPSLRHMNDALLGLIALGYKKADAQKIFTQLEKTGTVNAETDAETLIRLALRALN